MSWKKGSVSCISFPTQSPFRPSSLSLDPLAPGVESSRAECPTTRRRPTTNTSPVTAQYYTLKLILLAYLLHPKTRGATQLHDHVLKPALTAVQTPSNSYSKSSSSSFSTSTTSSNAATIQTQTPPTSNVSGSAGGSPTVVLPSGGGVGVGLEVPK